MLVYYTKNRYNIFKNKFKRIGKLIIICYIIFFCIKITFRAPLLFIDMLLFRLVTG